MALPKSARPIFKRFTNDGQGRRADLDNGFYRSRWEANYARYLNWLKAQGEIRDWKHEPTTFWFDGVRRGVTSYKPDFAVWLMKPEPRECRSDELFPAFPAKAATESAPSYYVEVKGWLDHRSRVALKRMSKYHPVVEVRLVDRKAYRSIEKWSGIIPGWESKARAA
jgi:hypothetical protein